MLKNKKTTCPYTEYPPTSYWSRSVVNTKLEDFDPVLRMPFKIKLDDKIATAGSCFAQHIAKRLQESGYHYFVTENAPNFIHPNIAKKYNYGTFSARFGNLYTTRQLSQLIDRCYGKFVSTESFWEQDGRYYDPLRPLIQPKGFGSLLEAELDRESHLRKVKLMIETMDVFVFTLGLTEAWLSTIDGTAFPVCPGCGTGKFDKSKYHFKNLTYEDVVADLTYIIETILEKNPECRFIFTVSPVPLIATAEDRHIMLSNTYSKSVLRVAVETVVSKFTQSIYFPSYEIITGGQAKGSYFENDLRSVREEGVDHVMKIFFKHLTDLPIRPNKKLITTQITQTPPPTNKSMDVVCDEEILEKY